jgi:acyl-CoA thioesterase
MSLISLFAAAARGGDINIPAGWTQGRANFGGLVAALMYASIAVPIKDDRVLRSATISFVGPVTTGAATITAELLRHGKSVTQAQARLVQNGEVVAVMLASFGAPRPSSLNVEAPAAPAFKSPDAAKALPYLPGLSPEFSQHFDYRWAHGDFPFTGSSLPELGGWMRLKGMRGPVDMMDLFLLVDAWPPALLPLLKAPAMVSSLTWTMEPLYLPARKTVRDWWQYQAVTDYAREGYGNCLARLWDDEGHLVAISRQTVAAFA